MTSLAEIPETDFDVVAALDNALPHLRPEQIDGAARAIASRLKPDELFIASLRDYDRLCIERPPIQEPVFFGKGFERRIIHQVWDWTGQSQYTVHLYITTQREGVWISHHFASEYNCLIRSELSTALERAGFEHARWITPQESGFYQPIVLARKRSHRR